MLVDRRLDDRGVHAKLLVDNRRSGLITARFDAQDQRHPNSVRRGRSVEVGPQYERVFADALVVVLANSHGTESIACVESLGAFVGDRDFEGGSCDATLL